MKSKLIALLLVLIIVCMSLSSCARFWLDTGDIRITYEMNNGKGSETLGLGLTGVMRPQTPTRDGYIFTGWYKDAECTKPYDFDQTPTESMTLYAGWHFDAEGLMNRFSDDLLKSSVLIRCSFYTTNMFGEKVNNKSVSGSGVIIYEDKDRYFILTNNHVVINTTNYNTEVYTVYDAFGTSYGASVLHRDSAYDLALMSIRKGKKKLAVAKLTSSVAPVGTHVLAVGCPDGQINTVTFGKIEKFDSFEMDATSTEGNTIEFPVLFHSAPIDNGSSGGALFNESLKLVGINFAATESGGAFKAGLAVSSDKAREFLRNTTLRLHF